MKFSIRTKAAYLLLATASFGIIAIDANAQYTGPSIQGNYSWSGGIVSNYSYPARTSIGASWGGSNPLYGNGYIGFNIAHEGTTMALPWLYLGDNANNGSSMIYGGVNGAMTFVTIRSNGGNGGALSNDSIRRFSRMRIDENGKVAIGNSFFTQNIGTPGNYKLYVEDGIMTETVKVAVKTTSDWADYVFANDYKLMPLPQLAQYIRNNSHLPGVPSAEEAVAGGVDLQKMDATLLQKVEELTLYLLAQQKEIEELKKKLGSQP